MSTPETPGRPPFPPRGLLLLLVVLGMVFAEARLLPGADAQIFVPTGHPLPPSGRFSGKYFRLTPTAPDTVYRLLVVPVRFPEDPGLHPQGRSAVAAALGDTASLSLNGYYRAATGGRLRVESTLAPTVVAEHPRTYYTVEGDGNLGFGLDPNAYPHNARRLVEEVTAKLVLAVDFRAYDNTRDGFVDGLLLLHSGPPSGEALDTVPSPEVLLAHAFTLEAPVDRGGAQVFPYAVASATDGIGVWSHEVGHLLGLPDLYTANSFCPGPGVGEWSLMATGANRDRGQDPSGLDPFSRQLLGMKSLSVSGLPIPLEEGEFLRLFRPGEAAGPRYFLVENRTGADGLGIDEPAVVVYYVDEDAGDNRSCPFPPEQYRPLVEVRAVLCPGGPCSTRIDDTTTPNLRDGEDRPTGLVLEISGGTVLARHELLPRARLQQVRISELRNILNSFSQSLILTVSNLDGIDSTRVVLSVSQDDPRLGLTNPTRTLVLAPGETRIDSAVSIGGSGPGPPPPVSSAFRFSVSSEDSLWSRTDTVRVPVNQFGLAGTVDARFTTTNRNPGRNNPWTLLDSTWRVSDLDPFADGEVASPWFSIPPDARLQLDHAWDLTALAPDLALDGAQVFLRRPLAPDTLLAPEGDWGFTAERKTGNAMAGTPVLSGTGSRLHVMSLADFSGDLARIVLRAAGDVEHQGGNWDLRAFSVLPAPDIAFSLIPDPLEENRLLAETVSPAAAGITLSLYQGPGITTPLDLGQQVPWTGASVQSLGIPPPRLRRFDLIWETADGRADMCTAELDLGFLSPAPAFLGAPYPNPLHLGIPQEWPITISKEDPLGAYTFVLTDVAGRSVTTRRFRVEVPGIRLIPWDGRRDDGRETPAGVYFLQVRRPDGRSEARKIVILP